MARRVLTGEKLEKELERLSLMREFERQYEDCAFICGIDEAGRGPLAGPVAAGAAILPKDCQILYLNDSKKLSESRREELFLEIKEKAIAWSVGIVGPERIDEINILQDETLPVKLRFVPRGYVREFKFDLAMENPSSCANAPSDITKPS